MGVWSDERIEQLKGFWKEGKSATEIAMVMPGGFTRNAIIGKVCRLGLSSERTMRTDAKSKFSRPAPSVPRRVTDPREIAALPAKGSMPHVTHADAANLPARSAPAPVRLFAAEFDYQPPGLPGPRQCKWPIGDPQKPGFHFCPNRRPDDEDVVPYCREHARIAYQPPQAKKQRQRDTAKDFRKYA